MIPAARQSEYRVACNTVLLAFSLDGEPVALTGAAVGDRLIASTY